MDDHGSNEDLQLENNDKELFEVINAEVNEDLDRVDVQSPDKNEVNDDEKNTEIPDHNIIPEIKEVLDEAQKFQENLTSDKNIVDSINQLEVNLKKIKKKKNTIKKRDSIKIQQKIHNKNESLASGYQADFSIASEKPNLNNIHQEERIKFEPIQKIIRYKLEDIAKPEYEKRVQDQENWIKEQIASKTPVKQIFTELLNIIKVVPRPLEFQEFYKVFLSIQSKTPQVSKKQDSKEKPKKKKKLSYDMFKESCIEWYNAIRCPKDLKSKIQSSIKEYEKVKEKMLPNEDQSFIDSLITTLKIQLKKILEGSNKSPPVLSFEEKSKNGISEIFKHYSKAQNTNGSITLEPIKKVFDTLNLSKFLQFCKDFTILEEHKNPSKNRIKQQTLEEVFNKYSNFKKEMYEYQFFEALETLAGVFFDEEYDLINKTHWKNLNDNEKTLKLYELLGFHEPSLYSRKFKQNKVQADSYMANKYTKDTSKIFSLAKNKSNAPVLEKIPQKIPIISKKPDNNEVFKENTNKFEEKPVTWEKLNQAQAEDEDELMDLIEENNKKDFKIKEIKSNQTLKNSISDKILKRAEELEKSNKKIEDEKIKQMFKIADEKAEKMQKYVKKNK